MKQNKESSNIANLWIIVTIIFIIAFSVVYSIKSSATPKVITESSNGYLFTKQGNFWTTTIRNPTLNREYNVEFRYSPSQVKNVSVQGDPKKFFTLLKLNNLTAAYFTFNPTENLTSVGIVAADTSRILNSLNGVTLVAGCTTNQTTACTDRPIVTCENQENRSLVIYVKQSDSPKIIMQKNCLTIEGSGEGLLKASAKLSFLWYNVI